MNRIIVDVQPKENLVLLVTFADGEIVSFDVSDLLERYPAFLRLKDQELFRQVRVDGAGYGITWNDELDLSSDGIYLKGQHVGKTDPEPRILLGQKLADFREEASLSQRDLSHLSGVIQAEISKIEQGKGNPTLLTLYKLAKALGKPVSAFFL